MKYLIVIALGMLTWGCQRDLRLVAPDSIKISPSIGWELQKDVATKQKPSVSMCAEWKIKK